jgi:hypothetical protein
MKPNMIAARTRRAPDVGHDDLDLVRRCRRGQAARLEPVAQPRRHSSRLNCGLSPCCFAASGDILATTCAHALEARDVALGHADPA